MAGTSLRRSIAEPDHLLFGSYTISIVAFMAFPFFSLFSIFGSNNNGLAVGFTVAAIGHLASVIVRKKVPYIDALISYTVLTRGLHRVFPRRKHNYIR